MAAVANEHRAKDVLVLELQDLTVITDFFVIASGGETALQVRAVAQAIIDDLEEDDIRYLRREGWEDARWVLLDYGSVVVHVFLDDQREYYQLERLWGDAPQRRVGE
ncbi:MAG: ribosome silencing factor [Limnochordia bacterium]